MGFGPMTGRGFGFCAGYDAPGYMYPGPGRGFGVGFGRGRGFGGRGWRHMYYATGMPGWMRSGGYPVPYGYPAAYVEPDPGMEKQALKNQAEALQAEMDYIKKRLSEIETDSEQE